ncbi:MAG: four helix bundle protein [Natronospirillum sp.]|uniref:four helix bundle protein n=1 Tax=Natronospirillum sp. TaxID=2812955 RepID=UPI0025F6B47C|nr:four helix bundle protein [Natronospirillum sp.]MCH8553029.1 four helix bundle protein [Natronospirillum sp.]
MYFERLEVWKRAAKLSAELYIYFNGFQDFGFRDQITRSGLSIPSNIAEGITRASIKDKLRFINMAYSSCAELRTQIYIGTRIDYVNQSTSKKWIAETQQISSMLHGLMQNLKAKMD